MYVCLRHFKANAWGGLTSSNVLQLALVVAGVRAKCMALPGMVPPRAFLDTKSGETQTEKTDFGKSYFVL